MFKPSAEHAAHLCNAQISFRWSTRPQNGIIEADNLDPKEGPVHCEFVDSEGAHIATGFGNNHSEAFENGFKKIASAGKPMTKGEMAALIAKQREELAALRAPVGAVARTETPANPNESEKRGSGRPPGSPNKPKDESAKTDTKTESKNDPGAGDTPPTP